ncbi:MAG: C1 family peptidase [Chitinophagaceae bacterium]|nr:C1 family peptidase [Chitinophagaceae bacterium]
MKKLLVTLCIISIAGNSATSQGLIFDANAFAKRKAIGISRDVLPASISFKKYTPMEYPQSGNTCVAQSFATARTILAAKSLGWTDREKITGLCFSPYYIYYRNKSDDDVNCNSGLVIETAAKDVLANGFAPIVDVEYPAYYPFTSEVLCVQKNGTSYPPSMTEDEQSAANYKIDEIYRVTSVQQLKTALAGGMPVVLCLFTPASFQKLKTPLWIPQPTDLLDKEKMGHAVLAIGYDNIKYGGAIEIMNSWGDTWGDKGFVWVRYKDYLKWFFAGYAFYQADNKSSNSIKEDSFKPQEKNNIPSSTVTIHRSTGSNHYASTFNNAAFLKAFKPK